MSEPLLEGDLGNLAQSARAKQLKTARGILYVVGILTIVVNVAFVINADKIVNSQIEDEVAKLRGQHMVIDQAKLADFRERAIQSTRLVNGIAVLIGLILVGCGVVVYTYPVAATVTSLVLYLGSAAVYGVLDPTTLVHGWLVKILIVVALFKAVQAALAYESERKLSAELPALGDLPATPI